jgi:predicted AlkP superfamily pyrophosphatase or phosphodiesterase
VSQFLRAWLFVVAVSSFSALAEKPRLAVVVVVDQLSAEAFRARLPKTTGGIKRLAAEGVVFDEARYEAAPTVTSVGHATIVTGAYGETHGIVGNEWYEGETGKPRLSTEDATYQVVGREPQVRDGTAPTWLRAPTLADSVKLSNEAAKAVSISAKDRSGILMAGRAGTAVWFDAEKPMFVTSTFYGKELPAWVKPTNEKLAKLVLSGALAWGLPGGGITGKSPSLPAPSGRVGDSEPFAERPEIQSTIDAAEVDVALDAVKLLELGKDEVPDLLEVSFSGHDRIGHEFGPDSPVGLMEFLAVDRELGRLLEGLDAMVGKGKYVVAFTSDHGVCPMPELSKARGLDSGRVDTKALGAALKAELDAALGPGDWLTGYKTPGFVINPKLRAKVPQAFERLRAVALRQPGVADLIWSPNLTHPTNPTEQLWQRGYVPGRTADLIIITRPFWSYGLGDHTGHASAYLYDRAVPLMFFGGEIKKGSAGSAEIIDLAPTVARLINVPVPAAARGHAIDAVFR